MLSISRIVYAPTHNARASIDESITILKKDGEIKMLRGRNTKIIVTLGPSSSTYDVIEKLFLKGADVFRLNFSHGNHEIHKSNLNYIRQIEKTYQKPIAVIADLQGPKLRIGTIQDGSVILEQGQSFVLDQLNEPGNNKRVHLPHPEIFAAVKKGSLILIDDGKVRLHVKEVKNKEIITKVVVAGILSDHKGVNVPDVMLPISALTEKDKKDLAFITALDIDWIALSFVQSKEDVALAKSLSQGIKIISKLEKPKAIEHLHDIVAVSDAVMVARGDLGVELPIARVPLVQKKIIKECRAMGKPVIVATQMLETMINVPTPTRAEVSDIANAIYDHVDAVMLSAESASGKFPLEAVEMMHNIIITTEKDNILSDHEVLKASSHKTVLDAITAAAREITEILNIKTIVCITATGATAYAAAKERPYAHIIAVTNKEKVARELALCWGVQSIVTDRSLNSPEMDIPALVKEKHFVKKGDKVIITSGTPFKEGSTHYLRVDEIV